MHEECGMKTSMKILNGKWKALIVHHLIKGPARFMKIKDFLEHASSRVLAEHLRDLEDDGIIIRSYQEGLEKYAHYSLTPLGHSLANVLLPICEWGREHADEVEKILSSPTR